MYRDGERLVLSATDLVGFLACPHYTTLSKQGGGSRRAADGEETDVDVLARRGLEHEAAYLAKLKAKGLRVVEIAAPGVAGSSLRAAEEATVKAMAEGADVVFQGTFFDEVGQTTWRGHADFLRRVVRDGVTTYEPEDTKLARHVKPAALLQLCLYAEQLERVYGVEPANIHVVLGSGERASFATVDLAAYYRKAREPFVEAAATERETYPVPVEHCTVCRFAEQCEARWQADDHLSLVASLAREQARKLEAFGVPTVAALAASGPALRIKGIGEETLRRLQRQARLQVKSRGRAGPPSFENLAPIELGFGLEALPAPSPGDLFFDMEGDPYVQDGGLEYLFGVGWYERGQFRFRAFWGHTPAEERSAFEGFMDFVAERRRLDPGLHVYHYASYERTALGKLAGRHATRVEHLDDLFREGVLVDLYAVVRQAVAIGTPSYSIKKLEPLYMAAREAAIKDGGSSIVQYERWLATQDPAILATIEEYNREDCVSTALLRDWLEARRPEVESAWGRPLERPVRGDDDRSRNVGEIQIEDVECERLKRRLSPTASEPLASASGEERGRWLLGHLLGWHRREDRPAWWAYYQRVLEMTDEDLVADSESIGELVFEREIGKVKRSVVYRYRFDPDQEHKIGEGSPVENPATERIRILGGERSERPGTIVAIDLRAGTLDLSRGLKSVAPHPTALVPSGPIDNKVLRQAVQRLAVDVCERGMDADGAGRAARDLLSRRPPRIKGLAPGSPLYVESSSETPLIGAQRLALGLEESYLPIQGPPGSGKTHTAAHVIVALVRAGKRVGVTATSHAVIGHVLEKVLEVAGASGVRILQKADDDQRCKDSRVESTTDNKEIVAALDEGRVDIVAGTSWLFARADLAGRLDTLLIDEAGQFSLANALGVGQAARNLILVGDPQQLAQPSKGRHPDGTEASALEHVLNGAPTVPADRGLFLHETYRMHPSICAFVSELSYGGRLGAVASCAGQVIEDGPVVAGAGLRWVGVEHAGNRTSSEEEAEAVASLVQGLLGRGWFDQRGAHRTIGLEDILVVAPFNAQVNLLAQTLPAGARVGTVDKFQGQEAAIAIVSMAASSAEDVPRGMEFLYSRNRLNVAVSRARAISVLVASPTLLAARCRTVEQMMLVNGLCRFVELATPVGRATVS